MLILKIKHAEAALTDGRLEEACQLVRDAELRKHARGQKLVGQLINALLERSRTHLNAERPEQAMADCERAARFDSGLPEIESIRQLALKSIADQHKQQQQNERVVREAAARIDAGQLSVGQKMLEDLSDDNSKQQQLLATAARRKATGDAAVERIRSAIKNDQVEMAIDGLSDLKRHYPTHGDIASLTNQVTVMVSQQGKTAFDQGRIDIAGALIKRFELLAPKRTQLDELTQAVEVCKRAWGLIADGQVDQAAELLQRLTLIFPDAKWLKEVIRQSRQTLDNLAQLRACPLGLLDGIPVSNNAITDPMTTEGTSRPNYLRGKSDLLPERFVIQVDGAGAFLVLRSDVVTIGPVSSPQLVDVGLVADPASGVATIERVEGDYFINGPGSVTVNDGKVGNRLLRDGDRVGLSRRCRMKFLLPNPATTTGVLELTGAQLPRPDIRRVVLMDEQLVIAGDGKGHIRCGSADRQVILHIRGGELYCSKDVMVDQRRYDANLGLPIGRQISIGRLSFVVTRT